VHQRLQGLLALSDEALHGLRESADDEVVLAGVKTRCVTWHFAKDDGSHWIVVELWDGGLLSRVWASEGISLLRGARRSLTREELNEGH